MPTKPEVLYSSMTALQAPVTYQERYRTHNKYGDMTPAMLTQYLNKVSDGELEDWIAICNYAQRTDAHLGSIFQTRIDRVIQAPWKLKPGKSTIPREQEQAENAVRFCNDVISEISGFDIHRRSILKAIPNGVSTHELVWTKRGGASVITDIIWRDAGRFRWDDEWKLRLYDSGTKGYPGEILWPNKWMVMVHMSTDGYPGEAGIMLQCIWPWLFKLWVMKAYVHATERYGQPSIYGTVPRNTPQNVRNEVLSALENLSYDSVALFEEGVEIMFQGGPQSAGDGRMFTELLNRVDAEQTKAVLGAEDIVSPGTHGSQAAVEERVEATLSPRTIMDAKLFATQFRDSILTPLCGLNRHLFAGVIPPIPKMIIGQDQEDTQVVYDVDTGVDTTEVQDTQAPSETVEDRAAETTPIEDEIQSTALNGAQITSLLEVISQVGAGLIPRDTGVEVLITAFQMDRATAERMMGDTGRGFVPRNPDKPDTKEMASVKKKASRLTTEQPDSTAGMSQTTRDSSRSHNPIRRVLSDG